MTLAGSQLHPVARRAKEWGAIQKESELSELVRLVDGLELQAVVEIGTGAGGTLLCWCQLGEPDAIVISVDVQGDQFGLGYSDERALEMKSLFPGERQSLHLITEDSHEESTLKEVQDRLGGRRIDLLFIDGDHTYEGVKRDFELYSPLVRSDGLIVFHDILEHPDVPSCRVSDFWNEVKGTYRCQELIDEPYDWGGLGVLWQQSSRFPRSRASGR